MKKISFPLLLLTLNYSTLQTTKIPLHLDIIQKTPLSYHHKCTLINMAQALKKTSSLAKNIINNKTHKQIKQEIEQKRLDIKNRYYKKEADILQQLKNDFNLTDNEWNQCRSTIESFKQAFLKQLHASSAHNDTPETCISIPQNITTLFKTLLNNNNIHESTISLKSEKEKEADVFAQASIAVTFLHSLENNRLMHSPSFLPQITFYAHVANLTAHEQQAVCAHEIEHLCQAHAITIIVLTKYLYYYKHIDHDIVEQNPLFQKLKVIYEEQAEIFAALKNAEIAQSFVNFRSKKYYPHHLYEAHYNDLVEINNLWRVEKLLTKFHSHSKEKSD